MDALILCGGFATRLEPITLFVPKPLLPIRGRPILDYILENVTRNGVNRIVVSTNRKFADQFTYWKTHRENMGGADLGYARLAHADLETANLGGANLGYADIRNADLKGANLSGAYLGYAKLFRAVATDAYMWGAFLRGADLRLADLRGAYIRGADLKGADIRGAKLYGTDLSGANVVGVRASRSMINDLLVATGVVRRGSEMPDREHGMKKLSVLGINADST